jgi:hypothetical protein
MPPVRMTVLDAHDGRPIAGAHVLFQAHAHEGTFTGHGGRGVNLFAAEAATDEAGEFRLPKQEFDARPFFLNTNYENPSITIFKPGYAVLTLRNNRRIIPELQDMTRWEWNGQTVRMKAGGDQDAAVALQVSSMNAQRAMGSRDLCSWKNFPRFLVAVERAAQDWNRRRASLDESLRHQHVSSPLQMLFMNEKVFIDKGCGSPKTFFDPYLR